MIDGDTTRQLDALLDNLKSVIKGKDEVLELVVTALCAGGNILMDDVPGVGKTTLAKALAMSIDGVFQRVQFTPDLLPSDITGSSIFNPKDAKFHFRKGPLFANIFLADEINRASPRTQSALLEAMNESQVTVEGTTYPLPDPFLVIATENPVEYQGTYPLPEAQLDRFAMMLELGYPSKKDEIEIVDSRKKSDPLDALKPVVDGVAIKKARKAVGEVEIDPSIADYMVEIARATREDTRVKLGASPRALLTLSRCARAKAFIEGRSHLLPDDVKSLSTVVIAHRLVLENKIKYGGGEKREVFQDILEKVPAPV